MKGFVHISGDAPGLIPIDYFDVILLPLKTFITELSELEPQEVYSEWLNELYIDEVSRKDFRTIVSMLKNHIESTHKADLPDGFLEFWNHEIMPLLDGDPRNPGEDAREI
ncbi:hypothetical protein E7T06_07400 [Deinococcus sp. Arct2-2]|uniref:hypothetical protein n=1 Tax=Deinococcus sp. Arct2-2 TaxID=2568653 RepID=UPI0010A53BA2|nr:hypothetical protein [Deinococcus sp. Arct2-2]THF70521.1 hypothetical protein E7T06_07400 [Deinococcus sp. Arct2-2]